jgi:abortive infection bacteriophage resistance protein
MLYNKPATTIATQVALLRDRGLLWKDEALVIRWLETVGYYRLSAYWLPYEEAPASLQTRSKKFRAGTHFEDIIDIYVFDRQLRLLVTEAIERIEIALRSRWTNRLSLTEGAHAHFITKNFISGGDHIRNLAKLISRVEQSNEVFVVHYKNKYKEPFMPPLWAVTELMTFGELSKWFASTRNARVKSAVAKDLGLPSKELLDGTIQLLSYIRNICAHHGRLWNRRTVKRLPYIRKFSADLTTTITGESDNSIYNVLAALIWLIRHQSPESSFPQRLQSLIKTRTIPQQTAMGFPLDWLDRPAWLNPINQAT